MSLPAEIRFHRGWLRAPSKRSAAGGLILAKNARYIPGDPVGLHAILGRKAFNSAAIGTSSLATTDESTIKAIFPVIFDQGSQKLVCHKGGTLWEADLALSGTFTEAQVMAQVAGDAIPRGVPAAFKNLLDSNTTWYYPVGQTQRADTYTLWARTSAGWRVGGHATPDDPFTVVLQGSGAYGSSTDIWFTYRIYDNVTDTESAHGPVVKLTAPGTAGTEFLWTWASGLTLQGAELGTHVRLYSTLPNETPGIFYRFDGVGDGLPIASFVPGFGYGDNPDATTLQLQGTVRADGEEGTLTWAEHGGRPPLAGGCIAYREHMVYFDLPQRPNWIIYSAAGYPESCPVDFDGNYQYWLPFQSSQDDRVLRCVIAGGYLLVCGQAAIHRASHLPTFNKPGFDREILEEVATDHGIAGRYAIDSFGVGEEQSQWALYATAEHGVRITSGIGSESVVEPADFKSLVEETAMDQIEVRNYPSMQECWVFYTPRGGSSNTEAMIVDYSMMRANGGGLRVTGPVPAKGVTSCYARGTDGVRRFYFADGSAGVVYVQDQGQIDEQKNYNFAGDIELDWRSGRHFLARDKNLAQVHRGLVYGLSGDSRQFRVYLLGLQGRNEYSETDLVTVGPGETSDEFYGELAAQGFVVRLHYVGPTGSSYYKDKATRTPEGTYAPAVDLVALEWSHAGAMTLTKEP